MSDRRALPNGVGLGLRWEFIQEVIDADDLDVAFFEVSPENYMGRGGYYPTALSEISERYPISSHGLTLSLAGAERPGERFLGQLREELQRLRAPFHSDHLCVACHAGTFAHELLPARFSREGALRVADGITRLQHALGVPLAIENITYYVHPGAVELNEVDYIGTILENSDAGLLLDVNNVFVNSVNHGFDPLRFVRQLPLERVVELHVAGHSHHASGLLLDTHSAPVCQEVLELLAFTLRQIGPRPVLLEWDNDVPPLGELLASVASVRQVYETATGAG